jgi:hypothetical protein
MEGGEMDGEGPSSSATETSLALHLMDNVFLLLVTAGTLKGIRPSDRFRFLLLKKTDLPPKLEDG